MTFRYLCRRAHAHAEELAWVALVLLAARLGRARQTEAEKVRPKERKRHV